MKKNILIMTALILFLGAPMKAQKMDYYTGKSEIKGSCYIYKVTKINILFMLQNTNNTRFGTTQYWPDGTRATTDQIHYGAHFIDRSQAISAFKEVFNTEEIAVLKSVKGLVIGIECIVGINGDVLEVRFCFTDNTQSLSINPDKFYALEQKVKQKVKFWVEERYHVLKFIPGKGIDIEFDSL